MQIENDNIVYMNIDGDIHYFHATSFIVDEKQMIKLRNINPQYHPKEIIIYDILTPSKIQK